MRSRLAVAAAAVALVVVAAPGVATAAVPSLAIGASYAPTQAGVAAVACPAARVCFVVGQTATGFSNVRATTDGGATWSTLFTAPPTEELSAIACASVTTCVVAGLSTLTPVTYWTSDAGAVWTPRRVPSDVTAVTSLSCEPDGACVAGGIDAVRGPSLFVVTDDGQRWVHHSIGPLVTRSFTGAVLAACVTAQLCVATQQAIGAPTLVTSADGGRHWRVRALPRRLTELLALGCSASGRCALAGRGPDGAVVALSTDAGASWSTAVQVAHGAVAFVSVSCGATTCAAVGADESEFVAVWGAAAGHWTTAVLSSDGVNPVEERVGCAGAGTCLAGSSDGSVALKEILVRGASAWHATDLATQQAEPVDVSCTTATHCVSVGIDAGGALAQVTNDAGQTWTASSLPLDLSQLDPVSCAATRCLALAATTSGDPAAVTSSDGGATWQFSSAPVLGNALDTVQCVTASFCVLGGTSDTLSPVLLVTTNGGTTWTQGSFAGSIPGGFAFVTNVTCTSSSDCLAAYLGAGAPGFLRTTNGGSTWTVVAGPTSLGFEAASPVGLACASATACIAVSEDQLGGFLGATTAQVATSADGGQTWTAQEAFGASILQISPVSCAGGTCTAIGYAGSPVVLTTTDGGTSWSSSPMPQGWSYSLDVSCAGPGQCVTVGVTTDGGLAFASS